MRLNPVYVHWYSVDEITHNTIENSIFLIKKKQRLTKSTLRFSLAFSTHNNCTALYTKKTFVDKIKLSKIKVSFQSHYSFKT